MVAVRDSWRLGRSRTTFTTCQLIWRKLIRLLQSIPCQTVYSPPWTTPTQMTVNTRCYKVKCIIRQILYQAVITPKITWWPPPCNSNKWITILILLDSKSSLSEVMTVRWVLCRAHQAIRSCCLLSKFHPSKSTKRPNKGHKVREMVGKIVILKQVIRNWVVWNQLKKVAKDQWKGSLLIIVNTNKL